MFAHFPLMQQKLQTAYYRYFRYGLGVALYVMSRALLSCGIKKKGVSVLLKSIRFNYNDRAIRFLKKMIAKEQQVIFSLVTKGVTEEEALSRTIILSLPTRQDDVISKGVILIKFTRTFSYFQDKNWFAKMDELFVFILEPSSAGYADADILSILLKSKHCFVQASEIEDRSLLNALFPRGCALSFGSSDWVDSSIFSPLNSPKKYDSICVANLNPVKRIYRYVDSVGNIVSGGDPSYKGCLVCASYGDTDGNQLGNIEKYIKDKGLESSLELSKGLSREKLVEKLNESKTSILLSYKEGSNRTIFESMFVNIPVICISENIGVNKSYVNEFTGTLVHDMFLEDALREMKSNWENYRAREWALENISPQVTTLKLSKILETKVGPLCNTALYVKVNRPELDYFNLYGHSAESIVRPIFRALASRDNVAIWREIDICYESLKVGAGELKN